MTKNITIKLKVPYSYYSVNYMLSHLESLEDKEALIILALANGHGTESWSDAFSRLFNVSEKFHDFFTPTVNKMLKNKTIESENQFDWNDPIKNYQINSKIQSLLDQNEFKGNSKKTFQKQIHLFKNLLTNAKFENRDFNDANWRKFDEEKYDGFIEINQDSIKNEERIKIWIDNNPDLVALTQNLIEVNFNNESAINDHTNIIYYLSDCVFKIEYEGDNNLVVYPTNILSTKIYDNYYTKNLFYNELYQLICDQLSTKYQSISCVNQLTKDLVKWDDAIINQNDLIRFQDYDYYFIDNSLRVLFIYKHEVEDFNTHHKGTIIELYYHLLTNDEIIKLVNDNLEDEKFVNQIYQRINNELVHNNILRLVTQNDNLIQKYKNLISNDFANCIEYLKQNKIAISTIYQLFGKEKTIDYLIKVNNPSFETNLKTVNIDDPNLQKLLISFYQWDYSSLQSHLKDSSEESNIIGLFKDRNSWFDQVNEYHKENEELKAIYKNGNDLLDRFKCLKGNLNLSCLTNAQNEINYKMNNLKYELAGKNIDTLTLYAKNNNRKILEYEIYNELLQLGRYKTGTSFDQIIEFCKQNKLLDNKEIKNLKKYQKDNNKFLHPDEEEIKNKISYSDDKTFKEFFKGLQEYNQFLSTLKNKIITWKKNNQEKPKKEDK